MKYIKSFLASVMLIISISSCDRDLPYPDRTESVAIDITRLSGTKGVIEDGKLDGDYKVQLLLNDMLGDAALVDHVQLVCVFTPSTNPSASYGENAPKTTTAVVAVDGITDYNQAVAFDLNAIYKSLNLNTPQLGEVLNFTTNVVLKDGTVILGWTPYGGASDGSGLYNNQSFIGWVIDGRAYSYKVRYAVVCPFVLDDYLGEAVMTDNTGFAETETYDVIVEKTKEEGSIIELTVKQFFDDEFEVILQIDTEDYSIMMLKKVLLPKYGSYNNLFVIGTGVVSTCEGTLDVKGAVGVDEGYFVSSPKAVWSIKKK